MLRLGVWTNVSATLAVALCVVASDPTGARGQTAAPDHSAIYLYKGTRIASSG